MDFVVNILLFLVDVYVYYVLAIKSFFSLFLPVSATAFFTGLIVNAVPIFALSRTMHDMSFWALIRRHYGLWIYTLIITTIWVFGSKDIVNFSTNHDKIGDERVSLFIFILGVWGVMSLRGEIYSRSIAVEKGLDRYNRKNKR